MSTRQVRPPSLISSLFTRCLYALQLGNVYIADYGNSRIRKVTMSTTTTSSPRYNSLLCTPHLMSHFFLHFLLLARVLPWPHIPQLQLRRYRHQLVVYQLVYHLLLRCNHYQPRHLAHLLCHPPLIPPTHRVCVCISWSHRDLRVYPQPRTRVIKCLMTR